MQLIHCKGLIYSSHLIKYWCNDNDYQDQQGDQLWVNIYMN